MKQIYDIFNIATDEGKANLNTMYAIWHLKNSNIYQYSFIADEIVYF